jgi:hypothetical protein
MMTARVLGDLLQVAVMMVGVIGDLLQVAVMMVDGVHGDLLHTVPHSWFGAGWDHLLLEDWRDCL